MVQASKYAVILGLLALSFSAYADGPYNRSVSRGAIGSASGSSGTVTLTAGQVGFGSGANTLTGDTGLTYVSATQTLMANFYGVSNNLTSSNTQVLYTSGSVIDGALGISYDRIQNFTFFGTPTGVTPPQPSATVHISGTQIVTGAISTTGVSVTGTVTSTVVRLVGASGVALLDFPTSCGFFTAGGNRRMGVCNNGVILSNNMLTTAAARVPLDVSGSIYATQAISTSQWVNVGSPTTPPACNALNAGNTFMNTTTHCLNYCDGTANRQLTSLAASCT